MSASSQYYAYLSSIKDVTTVLGAKFCRSSKSKECLSHFLNLSTATYVDIDYDTISRALVINAGWPSAPEEEGWTDTILRTKSDQTVEIGVLMHESNSDPEDIQFGGFLTVLGQDSSPSTPYNSSLISFKTNLSPRTNAFPNPYPTLPAPLLLILIRNSPTPPSNLHNRLPTPHRPPPNLNPLLPNNPPLAPQSNLQTPRPPHPPLLPLHR
jgi:hypothetical protein